MANSTFNGRDFLLDTKGVVYTKPLWIEQVTLFPNAAADAATLASWDENATPISSTYLATLTVTSASILTSTGNFTAAKCSAGDIIKIVDTSTGNNIGTYWILSRDTDNQITTSGATLTNDTGATYSWKIWTPSTTDVIQMVSAGTEKCTEVWTAAQGKRWFPNLVLSTLSSSAKVRVELA